MLFTTQVCDNFTETATEMILGYRYFPCDSAWSTNKALKSIVTACETSQRSLHRYERR